MSIERTWWYLRGVRKLRGRRAAARYLACRAIPHYHLYEAGLLALAAALAVSGGCPLQNVAKNASGAKTIWVEALPDG